MTVCSHGVLLLQRMKIMEKNVPYVLDCLDISLEPSVQASARFTFRHLKCGCIEFMKHKCFTLSVFPQCDIAHPVHGPGSCDCMAGNSPSVRTGIMNTGTDGMLLFICFFSFSVIQEHKRSAQNASRCSQHSHPEHEVCLIPCLNSPSGGSGCFSGSCIRTCGAVCSL